MYENAELEVYIKCYIRKSMNQNIIYKKQKMQSLSEMVEKLFNYYRLFTIANYNQTNMGQV